ncbi:uncharacterized protein B0H64DRAFT_315727 [Chaetomium fimeti]|uniref:NmrA-like domain-containing protein n=1 Tax=Chaetomium fimeti TaxID=1854472 RepID=A0AAE0LWY3_9PEZI|nr:hypothetical protein B0H64DRAFT_315727 [Chaetomium fimeti]
MTIVAVAGGSGDLGRLITDALSKTGKHEIYITSRKTDYSSEDALVEQLTKRNVRVVICTFIMDCDSASDAQLCLIRAADRCPCVERFIPSEFNVEYDVDDGILPYPEKRFHVAARRALEKTTSLEYAYIYPGMFMDYFGLPRVPSSLRPLCFFVDPENGLAVLPGDGEARMSMTFTTDAARYIALALELDKWPRVMTTASSTVSLNELVALFEKSLGRKLQVRYQPVEKLLRHEAFDLPTNVDIAGRFPDRFPGGLEQLRGLIADLEAGVAVGAFDFGNLRGDLNLVEAFQETSPAPKLIEDLVEEAWKDSREKPYGFQEVLYNAISVPPGSPALFLVGSSVTFSHTASSPHGELSSHALAPLLRNAWLQVRKQYPALATQNPRDGKRYTSPSSPEDLEAWLATTFIVIPGKKTWRDLWKTLVKTAHMTLYYLPEARQLFLQGEHHTLDGRGLMNFWDRFFRALASPVSTHELLQRTDGSEVARLPPRSDDLLGTTERRPGRGEQRALEILAPLAAMTEPISMPVRTPLPAPSPHNSALTLQAPGRTTAAIRAACKAQRLSVTAAWHAAAVLATQAIQAKRSTVRGTQFACFGNFDLRRYFPASQSQSQSQSGREDSDDDAPTALSNHHGVLPYVVDASPGRAFGQMVRELGAFYAQDLPRADPEVWSALGPMIRLMVPDFAVAGPQTRETTPALSSLGVVDQFVKERYGEWGVEEVWFGDTVTGPWLEHFMWAWRGRLVLNSCYNPAFYSPEEVGEFNATVLEVLLDGLGVAERGNL